MLTHFSLCSGIGGIDLAGEWAGFLTIGQSEIDEYASRVLAKNFKGVPNFGDIRTITNATVRAKGIEVGDITVLSAGFPCQPYSLAGHGKGDGDSRDLWGEVARIVGEFRPRWCIFENTKGLFARENARYLRRILSDLASFRYNATWGIWGASDVGACHKRERVFIICKRHTETTELSTPITNSEHLQKMQEFEKETVLAHAFSERWGSVEKDIQTQHSEMHQQLYASGQASEIELLFRFFREKPSGECGVCRNDNGLSKGVDRLRCIGNAVMPSQVYPIFKAIADFENGIL